MGESMTDEKIKRLQRADDNVSKHLDRLNDDEQMSVLTVACQERLITNFGKYGDGAVRYALDHLCSEVARGVIKFLEEYPFPSTTVH